MLWEPKGTGAIEEGLSDQNCSQWRKETITIARERARKEESKEETPCSGLLPDIPILTEPNWKAKGNSIQVIRSTEVSLLRPIAGQRRVEIFPKRYKPNSKDTKLCKVKNIQQNTPTAVTPKQQHQTEGDWGRNTLISLSSFQSAASTPNQLDTTVFITT